MASTEPMEFILLMHAGTKPDASAWGPYFAKLREANAFQGGSSIGDGMCASKSGEAHPLTAHLAGYIKVRARDIAHARELVDGNPVYEAGGVVEIRALPRD